MSIEEYRKACRLGRRSYRASLSRGESPFLPVLEQILQHTPIASQQQLGLVEIPLEQIVGTYYAGRQPTFTHDFLPLMGEKTEFAQKWSALCDAHLSSGIRDPIKAYEFMNRFYVVEGHKRVSVLRHFGAVSVHGTVTRILPVPDDSEESRIYTRFLHFYALTGVNYLWFSRESGFDDLLAYVHPTDAGATWDEQERRDFRGFYTAFRRAFEERATDKLTLTVGDALLVYAQIYDYADSLEKTTATLRGELASLWDEVCNRDMDASIHLVLKPTDRRPLFPVLSSSHLRIAFIHVGKAQTSSWVYAHELGRHDLEAAFDGQVETICLDGADTDEAAQQALTAAVCDRSDLIFTTSPRLLQPSVQAALANPKIAVLNCSLNTAHPSIRTYYARMYEGKFLMGAIAGSLTPDDRIGYIADYPIYGITANINAFALGARLVNPRAQVYLEWSKTIRSDYRDRLSRAGISYISDQDMIASGASLPHYVGLYHADGDNLSNLALSLCRWGQLYERIVRSYLNGSWNSDRVGTHAINYWWGMDSGVIDLICSRSLPEGTQRLMQLLKQGVSAGAFHPFSGRIRSQSGEIHDYQSRAITPQELITMDWLADNVIGSLPPFDELLPEAQALTRTQGIRKP
ncbi:MAG TPA: BMP family ABC transporter substrate-binding protein [Candidatus Agathobaculum intestinipullorum]|nr:BMP family ABC transporter substrate-binding protein [uncultured Agathobaculum sp.]HJA47860.1 BMP family ABC transporter substrate-binding protein [Candidatus Agathobaculum intestinipullorum]